jgi:LuxR family maltose regulon positive regulatory protein
MSEFESALIRSKLMVPHVAGLLHRPRVCEAIGRGLERKLTLIEAPAGYGKTAALVDFVQGCPLSVCWYTVDERDRDWHEFVSYLVGSIIEQFPGFGERTRESLAFVSENVSGDPTVIAGELTNDLVAFGAPLVMVVDNYESVVGAFGIRAFIHRLMEILPPNCHLFIGSRVLPDVPVTKLVAKRQLVGLKAADLCFDTGEIRDLLQLAGIDLAEDQVERVSAASEGWITAVLLLADLLREDLGKDLFHEGEATAGAYEYLAAEVLERQSPAVQGFLLASSVLREMTVPVCRDALGVGDPGSLLGEVERRNLFVTRYGDGVGATYRYHNLFRDFLGRRLSEREPDRYMELHLQAAAWFERAERVEEAVYHYLAGEAHAEAAVLMERVARECFVRGRVEMLLGWAEMLPDHLKSEAPRLLLYQSKVLTDRNDLPDALQALLGAESGFKARDDPVHLAKVYDQRGTLALLAGRYGEALEAAQAALELLAPDEVLERAAAERLAGKASVGLGRVDEGLARLRSALNLAREVGNPYGVAILLQDISHVLNTRGLFDESVQCLGEALSIARELGASVLLAGVLNNLGWIRHMQGEYLAARDLYSNGLAVACRGGHLRWQAFISVGTADLYCDVGAYELARPLYSVGWDIARDSNPDLAVYILAAQADMYRLKGDVKLALNLVDQARRMAADWDLTQDVEGLLEITEGIALAESGEVEAGVKLLAHAIRDFQGRKARRDEARAQLLLAKACFLAGKDTACEAALREAVTQADEIGTIQFIVAEGQRAVDLLQFGESQGVTACRRILEEVEQVRSLRESLLPANEEAEDALSKIEVYGLGVVRVVQDGHIVSSSEWQTVDAREMFFYFLTYPEVDRDSLGLAFWPDLSSRQVTNRFHVTLHRLRRALGDDVVVTQGEGLYALGDLDCWYDVGEFESLVERARLLPPGDPQTEHLWSCAVSVYRSDFLPGVDRPWCVPKRETLRGMYIEALVGMGRCHESRRDFLGAVTWYRRALEVDDLREDIHRCVMQCYYRAGQRSAAVRQYQDCRDLLERELGVLPSDESQKLLRLIIGKETVSDDEGVF